MGHLMRLGWDRLVAAFRRVLPEGSAGSKVVLVLAIVLIFEGISVLLLFSYDAVYLGLISIVVGLLLAALAYPSRAPQPVEEEIPSGEAEEQAEAEVMPEEYTFGIRVVEGFIRRIGGDYALMILGGVLLVATLIFNFYISARPDIGDLDTLMLMFAGFMIVYPFLANKFLAEAAFIFMFLGIVIVMLVLPQAVMSIHSGVGTSAGNWYVHYMLAAPFAGILDLVGIPASSSANWVTITFNDGTVQTLGISAYCAGLYSFSIFVSAFMSFILVLERLKPKPMVGIMALGLVIAYLGNLFRMVVIGIVGYFYGIDALMWAHRNAGWIIFLAWSAVFWYLVIRYAERHSKRAEATQNHT